MTRLDLTGLAVLGQVAGAWVGLGVLDGVCYLESYRVLSGSKGLAGYGWLGDGLVEELHDVFRHV